MNLDDFRKLQREHALVRASYMKFNIFRLLAFIPIFFLFFPLGYITGIKVYCFFTSYAPLLANPVIYSIIFFIILIPFLFVEPILIWKRMYPEMTGSEFAPLASPISIIFFSGVIIPVWQGSESFEPIVNDTISIIRTLL